MALAMLNPGDLPSTMNPLTWPDLLKLEKGNQVLHHTGNLATVIDAHPRRYEDGDIQLQFNSGSLKLLQINHRPQLEHHVFYRWSTGLQLPKFQADQSVWRRGDDVGTYHIVESISPNALGGYSYYLQDSRELHPENFLVHRSLAT